MEQNRFFRILWRFNAVVISLVGIVSFVCLLFGGYQIFKDITRKSSSQNIVNIETSDEVKIDWHLGSSEKIKGHSVLKIPLFSGQKYSQSYYSKSVKSSRNYLFINTETDSKHWLFSHNDYLVESAEELGLGGCQSQKISLAIIYEVIKSDTNIDMRLTNSDLKTLAISKPDGTNYIELVTELDDVIDYDVVNDNLVYVLYKKNDVVYSASINLSNFAVQNETEIPKVGSK